VAAEPRYREGVRAIAPIAAMAVLFGASFGVLARAAGFDAVAAVVMSATTFAGSAQFAAVSILGAGGSVAAAIAAAALLNARYAPIGISVASLFRGGFLRRAAEAQLVVDESWAIASTGPGRFDRGRLIGAGAVLYAVWVTGTVAGVAAGSALGDPKRYGLDAAFPALFLALLVPQLRSRRAVAATIAGGGIALALLPFTPPGTPIVAATAASLIGLRR
jgi:4-azaleucine resistance transporter AzlC